MNTYLKVIYYIIRHNKPVKWIPTLFTATFTQLIQRKFDITIQKRLSYGRSIFMFPRCNVSSLFMYTSIPDKKEILHLRKKVNKHINFLDIGSNIGSYSVFLSDKTQKIFAFEPHPVSNKRCRLNFILNDLNPNNVYDIALDDKIHDVFFSNKKDNLTENKITKKSRSALKVKAFTLDHWYKTMHFSSKDKFLIKIDVEGNEEKVILGGKKLFLSNSVIGILFESFDPKSVVHSLLTTLGYKISKISENNYWASKN